MRLCAGVKAYKLNRLRILKRWWIGLRAGRKTGCTCVWLWLPRFKLNTTTSWSRSHLLHSWYSGDNLKTLHMLFKCCRWRCSCIIIRLQFNDCCHIQFGCAVLLISSTEVVGCVPLSRLCLFIKLHQMLLKPLHALLYHSRDCAYHPAKFIIFAQLAVLCLGIILILPILPIVRTCKIAQTVSDSNHHRLNCLFRLSGRQSHASSCPPVFLPLLDRCQCIFNSRSRDSVISLNIILDPFLFL